MGRNKEWDDYGIGACNRMVFKDAALFLGCCAVTIVGTCGTINFGQELIEYCKSGEVFDFSFKLEESLKMSGAICSTFFGGCGMLASGHTLKKSLEFKQKRQEYIDSAPSCGIIKNYNR